MGLWVRSQDKKCLIKAKIIKFENGCLRGATDDDGWYYDLGKYKKERALKVLDEIQNILMPKVLLDLKTIMPNGDIQEENGVVYQNYNAEAKWEQPDTYVYEMPKE